MTNALENLQLDFLKRLEDYRLSTLDTEDLEYEVTDAADDFTVDLSSWALTSYMDDVGQDHIIPNGDPPYCAAGILREALVKELTRLALKRIKEKA